MKAVHTVLEPFFSEESKLTFTGGHVFSLDGKNLILGKNGFSIIISDGLLDGLRSQKASEDLWLKLIQHRLAFVNDEQKRLCTACTEKVIHPAFFMIDLTNRCNMACKYCLRDGDNTMTAKITSREMTEKICRYIADYCKKHGEDKIMVQPWGGEPLLEIGRAHV